ncbi:hypothetical protein D3C80_1737830 [compost metagenome]
MNPIHLVFNAMNNRILNERLNDERRNEQVVGLRINSEIIMQAILITEFLDFKIRMYHLDFLSQRRLFSAYLQIFAH